MRLGNESSNCPEAMKDSVYKESAPGSDSSSDDDLIVVKTEPCTIK